MEKQFKLVDDRDGSEPFGSEIAEGNAYIAAYPVPIKEHKHPLTLDVGESTICRYSLSGTKGVYRIVRVR